MSDVRTALRRAVRARALDACAALAWASGRQRHGLRRPRVSMLYLHSVPPAELTQFRKLVRFLAESHDLVSHSEAVALVERGTSRPTVSFSFDDGFRSNLAAAAVLEEVGARGCFFVPTGFVGIDSVEDARAFYGTRKGVDEPAMTWAELESLVARGHEIGSHTVTHRVIATIGSQEVVDEVAGAREILEARLGQGAHFAWPLGRFRHFSAEGARIVQAAGHVSCASAERGAHVGRSVSPFPCLRRDHLMSNWPMHHMRYFIQGARKTRGEWPDQWKVA